MQTSRKKTKQQWPSSFGEILADRKKNELQNIMRHTERLVMINAKLRQHLPQELISHCYVMQCTAKEITIAVDSAAWLTRLRYIQNQLLQELTQYPQLIHLEKMQIKVAPIENAMVLTPPPNRLLSSSVQELLCDLADSIVDEDLKKSLQKLARK